MYSNGSDTMSKESHNRAVQTYMDKTYDRVAIRVKKCIKARWQEYAAARGISFREFIETSAEEFIKNHPV